jgi:hypothetical protein
VHDRTRWRSKFFRRMSVYCMKTASYSVGFVTSAGLVKRGGRAGLSAESKEKANYEKGRRKT